MRRQIIPGAKESAHIDLRQRNEGTICKRILLRI